MMELLPTLALVLTAGWCNGQILGKSQLDGSIQCNGRYCNYGKVKGDRPVRTTIRPGGTPPPKISGCPKLENVLASFTGMYPEDYTIYYTNAGDVLDIGEEAIVMCTSPMAEMDFHGVPLQLNVTNGGWSEVVGECIRTSGCPSVPDIVRISPEGETPVFTYQEYRHGYPGEPPRPENWFKRYENLTYVTVKCPEGQNLALNPADGDHKKDFHCCDNGEIRLQ